ncbi:5-hydroxytryptamine receptor 3A-like isoform 2-T2 [Discoglossus pictus]
MARWAPTLILVVTLLGAGHCQNVCSYNDLLRNLSLNDSPGAFVRPVKDWRTPSTVLVNMFLYTVISLVWDNEFATWNPDDFCGIEKIYVSSDYFWKPDLYIYEMTEDDKSSPEIPYYLLNHNGTIVEAIPLRIISSCNLKIYKFPFDAQTCTLTFGPYVHTVKDILMLPSSNSSQVSDYSQEIFASRGDWSLIDITVENQTYLSEGDWYSQVVYTINIKRAPIIYIINLIIPACFLVLLDIVSMFIQMGTGERLGFKITVVLGFSVLLLILNDLLPNSDSPPVLGIFCCVCLAVMVFSIIGSIAISYMLTQSDTQPNVPPWIRTWILRHLARVLCFKNTIKREDLVSVVAVAGNTVPEDSRPTNPDTEFREKIKGSTKGSLEAKLLKKLLSEILKIHQDLTNTKNESDAKTDWYMAALVVDRLVLFVYLFTVVIIFAIVIIVWSS